MSGRPNPLLKAGWHKPMLPTDEFTFGKYRGNTFAEVFEINPHYILWANSRCLVDLDRETYEMVRDAVDELGEADCYDEDPNDLGFSWEDQF